MKDKKAPILLCYYEDSRRREEKSTLEVEAAGPKRIGFERDIHGLKAEMRFLWFDLAEFQFPLLQSGDEATTLKRNRKRQLVKYQLVSTLPGGVQQMLIPCILWYMRTASVNLCLQSFNHSMSRVSTEALPFVTMIILPSLISRTLV